MCWIWAHGKHMQIHITMKVHHIHVCMYHVCMYVCMYVCTWMTGTAAINVKGSNSVRIVRSLPIIRVLTAAKKVVREIQEFYRKMCTYTSWLC